MKRVSFSQDISDSPSPSSSLAETSYEEAQQDSFRDPFQEQSEDPFRDPFDDVFGEPLEQPSQKSFTDPFGDAEPGKNSFLDHPYRPHSALMPLDTTKRT